MRVRWERIAGIVCLITFTVLAVRLRPFLGHLLEVVNQDYDYQNPIKATMLGVLCLTLLAAIKLILKK